jgi:serine/threonine protein phosphatase PrpC
MKATFQTAAGNPENQDRCAIMEIPSGLVLVVADGAGGQSGGAEAAVTAVEQVRRSARELISPEACVQVLQRIDQQIANARQAGETTCALAIATATRVLGASVGDSGAWLLTGAGYLNLTEAQSRKPFLGTGVATVVPFDKAVEGPARLLLASDGLLKYASADRIIGALRTDGIETAASQLVALVRYPSGSYPDDVTVILASVL